MGNRGSRWLLGLGLAGMSFLVLFCWMAFRAGRAVPKRPGGELWLGDWAVRFRPRPADPKVQTFEIAPEEIIEEKHLPGLTLRHRSPRPKELVITGGRIRVESKPGGRSIVTVENGKVTRR